MQWIETSEKNRYTIDILYYLLVFCTAKAMNE